MKIYLAGVPGAPEQNEFNIRFAHRLISFFDLLPGGRLCKFGKKMLRVYGKRAKP